MLHFGFNVVLALGLTVAAQGYEVKNDKNIEASAAARAASRIGDIRGSIGFDDVAVIVVIQDPTIEPPQDENLMPRPAWNPPEVDKEILPPMVDNNFAPDRSILTGSVNTPSETDWELFDADGEPIRRFGFW